MDAPSIKKPIGLLDYLLVLAKWRKWLSINFFAVCAIAAIFVSLLPKWYQATATILPPRKEAGLFGLSSLMNNIPFGGFELLKGSDEVMIYLAILKSRTLMEAVAKKLDLAQVYEIDDAEKLLKALAGNVNITVAKEGTISISVLDKDPQRAAAIANAFVHYLDSLSVELSIQKARNNRIFIEKRFNQNKEDLTKAEEELKSFQEKYGAIALPVQTEAAIRSAAELQATITATEVELGVMEKNLTPTHAEVAQTKNKLVELKKKLNEMAYGGGHQPQGANGGSNSAVLFIPFMEVPQIGLEYARRFRALEVQKTLYQLLIQQYEQAKIQEAKDIPTVQVLDAAIPPHFKAKPKRMTTTLLAGLSATLIFVAFIFVLERLRLLREEDPHQYQKLASVFRILRKVPGHA
jgi:uncharacterized protein involved in exopolysaccharide biosynthesis